MIKKVAFCIDDEVWNRIRVSCVFNRMTTGEFIYKIYESYIASLSELKTEKTMVKTETISENQT
jgi:hypothetical protein